jgi:hypothetical protein
MHLYFLSALVLGTSVATAAIARADVGLLESTSGGVQVLRPAKNKWSRGSPMLTVADGGRVKVAPGGSAVVMLFANGARFQLAPNSTVSFSETGARGVAGAAPRSLKARPKRQANAAAGSRVARGRLGGVVLRNGTQKIELRSLFDTATLEARPTFRWLAVPDAASYQVKVFADGNEPLWQSEATATEIQYPDDAPALKPGQSYDWEVSTTVGDTRHERKGVFALLGAEEVQAVAQELAALKAENNDADAAGVLEDVLRADVYASHELFDNALAIYEALVKKHPDSEPIHLALAKMLEAQDRHEEGKSHRKAAAQLEAEIEAEKKG